MRWTSSTAVVAVKRICCASAAVCCFASPSSASAATTAQIDDARTEGLTWLFQNQQGDGSESAATGLQVPATRAALNAILNVGIQNGDTYYAAIAHLANARRAAINGQARRLATMLCTGSDIGQLTTQLQAARNLYYGWGSLPKHGSSPADTGLAQSVMLDAARGYTNGDTISGLCNGVLMTQRSGGCCSDQGMGGNFADTAASDSWEREEHTGMQSTCVSNSGLKAPQIDKVACRSERNLNVA